MAAANPLTYRWVPGSFVKNPSNTTDPPACGGTLLGSLADVVWRPVVGRHLVEYEEFGRPGEVIRTGEFWILEANLRGWDSDIATLLFSGTATGAVFGGTGATSHPTVVKRAGTRLGAAAFKLLFVPDNWYEHEAIFLPRAVAMFGAEVSANLDMLDERLFTVEFLGLPHATLNDQAALLRDLVIA
jgi:hypothetical protein